MKFILPPGERLAFQSPATSMLADWLTLHRRIRNEAWERVLRQFFDEHECGMPTPETLRNHGRWIIPHVAQSKGSWHQLFQWRGQIVFEGWTQQEERGRRYVIHPHTAETPKPWDSDRLKAELPTQTEIP